MNLPPLRKRPVKLLAVFASSGEVKFISDGEIFKLLAFQTISALYLASTSPKSSDHFIAR